jgi:hypothetical protein
MIATLALVAAGCSLAFSMTSVGASSRKAEKIINKHVAAIGGSKLKSIAAMQAVGTVEVKGVTISFTLWRQRPDLSRLDMTVMGYDVIQAYDGETAWWINPVAGATQPEKMPADFAREMIRWSDFDGPLVDYKKKRHKIKYLGQDTLGTGNAYKLRVSLAGGDQIYAYIDGDTYLEVKRTYTQLDKGRTITVDTYFSNFTEVDGVTTPRMIRGVGLGGEPFTMTFSSIDLDVEADEARFVMPGRKKKGGFLGY